MNWKCTSEEHCWLAHASRPVGGRYEITKYGSERNWAGFYTEVTYRVVHRSRGRTRHDLYGVSLLGVRTQARTLLRRRR
jgi:hypothetical protein